MSIVGDLAAAIGLGNQGVALARALTKKGVRTRADLRAPEVLATLPIAARMNVLYGVHTTSMPIATARAVADELRARLVFCEGKRCVRRPVAVVGSVRRGAPTVHDVDLLVIAPEKSGLLGARLTAPRSKEHRAGVRLVKMYAHGARHASFVVQYAPGRYVHMDLFLAAPAEKPYALFHYTGDKSYNVRTRMHAKRNGLLLNQYGLFDVATKRRRPAVTTERELAKALGVTYHPPEDRH